MLSIDGLVAGYPAGFALPPVNLDLAAGSIVWLGGQPAALQHTPVTG